MHKQKINDLHEEIEKQKKITQEWQNFHSEKVIKIKDVEVELAKQLSLNTPYKNALKKYKTRDRKAMYLLSLLHFKGYPVTAMYENEVKNLPVEKLLFYTKNYLEGLNEIEEDELEGLSNTIYDFDTSFLNTSSIKLLNRKDEASQILKLDDLLFEDSNPYFGSHNTSNEKDQSISTKQMSNLKRENFNKTYTKSRSNSYSAPNKEQHKSSTPTAKMASLLSKFVNPLPADDLKKVEVPFFSNYNNSMKRQSASFKHKRQFSQA